MAENLTREDYCERCGSNHVMWYEVYYRRHVVGCRRCGIQVALISDVALSTFSDSDPVIRLYHRMVEKRRLVEVGSVVAHG